MRLSCVVVVLFLFSVWMKSCPGLPSLDGLHLTDLHVFSVIFEVLCYAGVCFWVVLSWFMALSVPSCPSVGELRAVSAGPGPRWILPENCLC